MAEPAYDYSTRQGIVPISWEDFHALSRALARAAAGWQTELVLAIARGGTYPGSLIAHVLRIDVHVVRVSRRVVDTVTYAEPRWLIEPPAAIAGRRVLVVDEMCDSGQTLQMVVARARTLGAAQVKSAVLYAHSWGSATPDAIGLITDGLVLNPWDREVLAADGTFELHPEYVEALRLQGRAADGSLLIDAPQVTLAKGA